MPCFYVISEQAERKATKIVRRTSGHMAPVRQSLPAGKIKKEIARSHDELIRDMSFDDRGIKCLAPLEGTVLPRDSRSSEKFIYESQLIWLGKCGGFVGNQYRHET